MRQQSLVWTGEARFMESFRSEWWSGSIPEKWAYFFEIRQCARACDAEMKGTKRRVGGAEGVSSLAREGDLPVKECCLADLHTMGFTKDFRKVKPKNKPTLSSSET